MRDAKSLLWICTAILRSIKIQISVISVIHMLEHVCHLRCWKYIILSPHSVDGASGYNSFQLSADTNIIIRTIQWDSTIWELFCWQGFTATVAWRSNSTMMFCVIQLLVHGLTLTTLGAPFTNLVDIYPSMDKYLHPLESMGWNYLPISQLQRLHRWSLGMDK